MPSDFIKDLVQHKQWVAENMQTAATELFQRATIHDNSKFSPEEFELYDRLFPELQKYAYGTSELKAVYTQLGPALNHHLKVNQHHPEYHENGINGMNLIDLIEMVCDWMAASKRSKTGIERGLEINKERYGIGDQLFEIVKNTVAMLLEEV
jgi:Family of unknown function (DUF5662)